MLSKCDKPEKLTADLEQCPVDRWRFACSKTPTVPERPGASGSVHQTHVYTCDKQRTFITAHILIKHQWLKALEIQRPDLLQCFSTESRCCNSLLIFVLLLIQCSPSEASWFSRLGQLTYDRSCLPSSSTWCNLCWCSVRLAFSAFRVEIIEKWTTSC